MPKIVYKNRAGARAFGDKLVKAMVDNLNKTVKKEGVKDIKIPSVKK